MFAFDAEQQPADLRRSLRVIEADAGRVRGGSSCTLDLDLLLVGNVTLDTAKLTLPRPDILRDAFVLYPLSVLAPSLLHPQCGETMRALWARKAGQEIAAPQPVDWLPRIVA